MRLFRHGLVAFVMVVVLVMGVTPTASAAHNGNNKAVIAGTTDIDATGKAVVNYSEGQGTFNGTITVRNLIAGATYTFQVSGTAASTPGVNVCTGVANSQGTFTCGFQSTALPGFATAEVEDVNGNVVATGTFDRGGNCRDADQAGSQCDAPGRHQH